MRRPYFCLLFCILSLALWGQRRGLLQMSDDQLKIAEARSLGLDTTFIFLFNQKKYRTDAVKNLLFDELNADAAMPHRMEQQVLTTDKRILIQQVVKRLPQHSSASYHRQAQSLLDSLFRVMQSNPYADFDTWVKQYSDEKQEQWMRRKERPEDFESVVFSLQKGQVSPPFYSSEGIHLVWVVDVEEPTSIYSEPLLDKERLFELLKAKFNYAPDLSAVNELTSGRLFKATLFTLNAEPYTVDDFQLFAEAFPSGDIAKQYQLFVEKSVFDYADSHAEQYYPLLGPELKKFRDETLLAQITRLRVEDPARNDKAGLEAYFTVHKKDYYWDRPRFKGIVVYCSNKKVRKQVRKTTKKLSPEASIEELKKHFGDTDLIHISKGEDARSPLVGYPYQVKIGKTMKGPDNYQEALDALVIDYQNFLEEKWIASLRANSKVEINQEVLKTVNNDSSN